MKFLLHSSEATYDTATKKFLYNLDERISNPTVIQISKACFTCTSKGLKLKSVYSRRDKMSKRVNCRKLKNWSCGEAVGKRRRRPDFEHNMTSF